MHMGYTSGPDTLSPLVNLSDGRTDGAAAQEGRISGTYIHGLFASDAFRHGFLRRINDRYSTTFAWNKSLDAALDLLADHMQCYLDTESILEIAQSS
jgi:adenosylcobyric acid synthase